MRLFSASVEMYPVKNKYMTIPNTVYASLTFENHEEMQDVLKGLCKKLTYKSNAVVVNDPCINSYRDYFEKTDICVSNERGILFAIDITDSEMNQVISNWGFFEIGVDIYFCENRDDFESLHFDKIVRLKDIISLVVNDRIDLVLHQELDNTVVIVCRKPLWNNIWTILKDCIIF